MATAERVTTIHNPAKGHRMTAKQIKFFGTKRQRAALKAKRHKTAAKAHRARSKPAKRKANRATPKPASSHKKRTNPGAIYALVNPAKGHTKMAAKKHHKKKASGHPFAGKRKKNPGRGYRRSNPGMLPRPADWLALGGGAVVGGVGATQLPIMILGTSNTGIFGYIATIAATGILAVAGHYLFKRNTMLTAGVVAGGAGALIRRIMQDYSVPGAALVNAGVGDIITDFNFQTPQTIAPSAGNDQLRGGFTPPPAMPVSVQGIPAPAGVSGGFAY